MIIKITTCYCPILFMLLIINLNEKVLKRINNNARFIKTERSKAIMIKPYLEYDTG